jgi:Ni/Co efflux regulator RcnB
MRYGARGPEWHRGGHIPAAYRDRVYAVNDWRMHRLAPPPRGYQWVQVGPDYVLVTVRTGVIAQIVVG